MCVFIQKYHIICSVQTGQTIPVTMMCTCCFLYILLCMKQKLNNGAEICMMMCLLVLDKLVRTGTVSVQTKRFSLASSNPG